MREKLGMKITNKDFERKAKNWQRNDIKIRLGRENEVYDWVLSDLETLENMLNELINKMPKALGTRFPDELHLQNIGINVLAISLLEYLLKELGKINKQYEIKNIINGSSILTENEKANLLFLLDVRHTIAHNIGHPDKKFLNNIKKYNNTLLADKKKPYLTAIAPAHLITDIRLIQKLIFIDIAKDELSDEEKQIIEGSLK